MTLFWSYDTSVCKYISGRRNKLFVEIVGIV